MKKILIFSITIAMLVCAGCGTTSNTAQKNKSTVATTETTEEVVYKDPITYTEYETLDALTADFPENSPALHNTSHRRQSWTAGNSGWDALITHTITIPSTTPSRDAPSSWRSVQRHTITICRNGWTS